MYQDAGYGANWQPRGNDARRIDPSNRSCVLLACLFTIGFLLIIAIVLSLMPIYISKNSSSSAATATKYLQVSKISISDLLLEFSPLSNESNSAITFSNANNRLALEASLTSLIQNDSILTGAVIDIVQGSEPNQTLAINVIGNTSCLVDRCLTLFQQHTIEQLTFHNQTTTIIRCEDENSKNTSESFWMRYRLPEEISTNASFVNIDPSTVSSLLANLLFIDRNSNQLPNP